MNILKAVRQGMQDARVNSALRLDEKRTRKALRLNPDAEYLWTEVHTGMEMQELVSQNWQVMMVTNLTPAGGTSIFSKYLLRKSNPNLIDQTP